MTVSIPKRVTPPLERGLIFIISAPSGTGKTTLIKYVLSRLKKIRFSVSATTRSARPNETHGKDYFFLTLPAFQKMVKQGAFAEYKIVHGHYYGTLKKQVFDVIQRGLDIILDIDVAGKIEFTKKIPEAISIFIKPPSLSELKKRILRRGMDSSAEIKIRMRNARQELELAQKKGHYDYTIVNRDVRESQKQILKLIHNQHRFKNGSRRTH